MPQLKLFKLCSIKTKVHLIVKNIYNVLKIKVRKLQKIPFTVLNELTDSLTLGIANKNGRKYYILAN